MRLCVDIILFPFLKIYNRVLKNEHEITSPTIKYPKNIKNLILVVAIPCGCPTLRNQFVIGQAQGSALTWGNYFVSVPN